MVARASRRGLAFAAFFALLGGLTFLTTPASASSNYGSGTYGAGVYGGGASDTTAPHVEVTVPAASATVSGSSVTLTASSSDETAIAGITFYVSGVKQGVEITVGSSTLYSTIWDSTATSSGSHTVFAVARDTSNNYATSSAISITVSNSSGSSGGSGGGSSSGGGGSISIIGSGSSTPNPLPGATPNVTTLGNTTSTSSFFFARDLQFGMTATDVRQLQIFLNSRGYLVAATGAGSVGQETLLFGNGTRAALAKFQVASGITPALGYFGIKTRTLVNTGAVPQAPAIPSVPATGLGMRDLQLKSTGADVRSLQQFLIAQDAGPAAHALAIHGTTLLFGPLTQAALAEYQTAHNISPATGYYGAKTRAFIGL